MVTWLCIGLHCTPTTPPVVSRVHMSTLYVPDVLYVLCSPMDLLNSTYVFVYVSIVVYYKYLHVCEILTGALRISDVHCE